MNRCLTTRAIMALNTLLALSVIARADEPTPYSIIDRAIKAGGGIDKIRQIKAISFKGTEKGKGLNEYQFEGIFSGPMQFHFKEKGDSSFEIIATDGTIWYRETVDGPFSEATKGKAGFDATAALMHVICTVDQLHSLKAKQYDLSVLGKRPVNGISTFAVLVKHETRRDLTIFFDEKTGLPLKSQANLAIGERDTEVWFSDYIEIDGVKQFSKLRLSFPHVTSEMRFRDIRLLRSIDANEIKKPE